MCFCTNERDESEILYRGGISTLLDLESKTLEKINAREILLDRRGGRFYLIDRAVCLRK
jgi:hypothetical protein